MIAFIAILDYKFNIQNLLQSACKTMKKFSTTASLKTKKHSQIMHKQPLTYQR